MSDLVAYVDGGSLGNPGSAGIGVVIDDPRGGKIRIAKWIGRQDNNVAEYLALLEALQCALALKANSRPAWLQLLGADRAPAPRLGYARRGPGRMGPACVGYAGQDPLR